MVNIELPYGKENVRRVEAIIRERQLSAQVILHPTTLIRNLESHLKLYGGTADQVLKCLCFMSRGKPLVVMASGEIRIDMKKLEKLSDIKDCRMATPQELEKEFGRIPGSIDPLTIPENIPVFADEKLFQKEWVVGSAGSPYAGLKIAPKEILKVRNVKIADLASAVEVKK